MAEALTSDTVGPGAPVGERRAPSARKRLTPVGLLSPGAVWLLAFFLLPVGLMVVTSLKTGGLLSGGFSFELPGAWANYPQALSENSQFLIRSVTYSAIVTAAALILAYPLAYWIAFYGGRWKSSLLLVMLLPFFVSFVIRTVQWKFILADNGYVVGTLKDWGLLPQNFHILATPVAVIAGITYNYLPFTALPLYVALERIDKGLVEAAKDLYANKVTAFLKVVLPLSFPGVFAAILLTFVPATGDYVNSDVLGSQATFMVGQRIQYEFLTSLDYPEASALALVLMVGMVFVATIYAKILGTEDETIAAGAAV